MLHLSCKRQSVKHCASTFKSIHMAHLLVKKQLVSKLRRMEVGVLQTASRIVFTLKPQHFERFFGCVITSEVHGDGNRAQWVFAPLQLQCMYQIQKQLLGIRTQIAHVDIPVWLHLKSGQKLKENMAKAIFGQCKNSVCAVFIKKESK